MLKLNPKSTFRNINIFCLFNAIFYENSKHSQP